MNWKILNRDVIKVIALFLMMGNHIAYVFMMPGSLKAELLIDLGCFTAPVMCCFLVEGFYKTRSRKRYGQRLAAFALLSQLPFYLAFYPAWIKLYNFNMITSLFLCFLMLCVLESSWDERSRQIAIACIFAAGCFCDWPVRAQVFVFIFWRLHRMEEAGRVRRGDKAEAWLAVIAISVVIEGLDALAEGGGMRQVLLHFGRITGPALAAVVILCFYNGKQARRGREYLKWFSYIFYPAHLLVLGLIRMTME